MNNLRIGIVGVGWIAATHVPVLDAAEGAELVAACDSDLARAHAIAGPSGARAYGNWEDMLEREALDAVWVCTPPLFHREPAVAALERGIHVYLEKPIARTLADAEAIVAAAARSDAICAVGYQWRATELLDRVRETAQPQTIGLLVSRNYGPVVGRAWFISREESGGQILERASHHIDLQRAIAGEIAAVEALSGSVKLAQVPGSGGDIEDALTLVLHFRSGAVGSVSVAWTPDGHPSLHTLDVISSDASMWLNLGPETFHLGGFARGRELSARYGDPMQRSITRFLELARARDKSHVFCTPQDALGTLAVGICCERALVDGGTVAVPPVTERTSSQAVFAPGASSDDSDGTLQP
jgi:predicted dehydrogenase